MQPSADGGAACCRVWLRGINLRERLQARRSWGEGKRDDEAVGQKAKRCAPRLAQDRVGGNEKRGQERRGEHQTDNEGRDTDV